MRHHRALVESLLIFGLLFSALICQKPWLAPLACKDALPNSLDRASTDMVQQAIKAAELSSPTLPRRSSTTHKHQWNLNTISALLSSGKSSDIARSSLLNIRVSIFALRLASLSAVFGVIFGANCRDGFGALSALTAHWCNSVIKDQCPALLTKVHYASVLHSPLRAVSPVGLDTLTRGLFIGRAMPV